MCDIVIKCPKTRTRQQYVPTITTTLKTTTVAKYLTNQNKRLAESHATFNRTYVGMRLVLGHNSHIRGRESTSNEIVRRFRLSKVYFISRC